MTMPLQTRIRRTFNGNPSDPCTDRTTCCLTSIIKTGTRLNYRRSTPDTYTVRTIGINEYRKWERANLHFRFVSRSKVQFRLCEDLTWKRCVWYSGRPSRAQNGCQMSNLGRGAKLKRYETYIVRFCIEIVMSRKSKK